MDKEKVLDKIKKCLALGQSANEHEAAQALKQAQALMEKYEVNAVDIALSRVSEQKADRKMAFKLADWQWGIANMIAEYIREPILPTREDDDVLRHWKSSRNLSLCL